jgi:hypothetical protein
LLAVANVASRSDSLDLPQCIISLKGDFVVASGVAVDAGVLDGDNIGGKVGDNSYTRPGPISGGRNPSGNLAEGGLFESWFFLSPLKSATAGTTAPVDHMEILSAVAPVLFGTAAAPPPAANFSSAKQIAEATGVSQQLADRIVQERAAKPFNSAEDLKKRLNISGADWKKLQSKLLML